MRGIWKHSLNRRRVLGSCEFNFASSTSKDEIKIIGMNGAIAFSCFDDKPVRVTTRKGEETLLDSEHPEHVHQPLVQAIVNALLSKGDDESKSPHVLCSGETALRTSQVMDRLLNDRSSWDAAYL